MSTNDAPITKGQDKAPEDWTPEDFLVGIDQPDEVQAVEHDPDHHYDYPDAPGFDDAVAQGLAHRVAVHQVVAALAEVRKAVGQTQLDVAETWGRPQSKVSRLEGDPERAQVATLSDYVRALGGHLAIEAEVDGNIIRYELV